MIKNLLLLIFFASTLPPVFSQDTIALKLNSDKNIVVQAIVNHTDTLDLMLHTAANVFSIIKSSVPSLKSIHFDHKDSTESWGSTNEARFSMNNSLQLRKLNLPGSLSGSQIDMIDYDSLRIWENEHSGKDTDGKIGIDLLESNRLELNFENNIIVLHKTLPTIPNGYTEHRITIDGIFIFIEGEIATKNNQIKHQFLIHSGYAGAALLDDTFTETNRIFESVAITSQQDLYDSYGNVLKTCKGTLEQFALGAHEMEQCPVSFFTGSIKNQKMSVIGMDIISRFNWIFDFDKSLVYLKRIS